MQVEVRRFHVPAAVLALPLVALLAAGLSGCARAVAAGRAPANLAQGAPAQKLRLGYLANLTQALPLVGLAQGHYQRALAGTRLQTQVFNAGPAAVEALFGGDLDAAYVGPNPAINAFVRSHGAFVIVSGAASGGAQLVTRPEITTPAQLAGQTLASPQLGNTQDVALRTWLAQQGLPTKVSGGGPVTVAPQDNSTTVSSFTGGKVAGAWVPEPWASRLVLEGHGRVLVDEKSLWPQQRFATTELLVSKRFLAAHPQTVQELLQGELDTVGWMGAHRDQTRALVNHELTRLTGKGLKAAVVARALNDVSITTDPVAGSLAVSARNARDLRLLEPADLKGILDVRLLNQLLAARGKPTIDAAGLAA